MELGQSRSFAAIVPVHSIKLRTLSLTPPTPPLLPAPTELADAKALAEKAALKAAAAAGGAAPAKK